MLTSCSFCADFCLSGLAALIFICSNCPEMGVQLEEYVVQFVKYEVQFVEYDAELVRYAVFRRVK